MNSSSTQKRILLWLIAAAVVSALVFGVLLFRQFRVRVAESAANQAVNPDTALRPPPSPAAEAQARAGFNQLLNQQNPLGARTIFEACVREYPDYADAFHGLAIAQREAGDPAQALTNHDRAIELAPERADYYWWQGVTYQRLNSHDAAIKTFERGLKAAETRHCRPGLLQVSLAQSFRAQGAHNKALAYNEEAIAQNPENAWYYQERGLTHRALGNQERAEADFSKARELQ